MVLSEILECNDRLLDVNLESPHFTFEEYNQLKCSIEEDENSLPEICVGRISLQKMNFSTGNGAGGDNTSKLWVPKKLRPCLMAAVHSSLSSGYGGVHTTLQRLKEELVHQPAHALYCVTVSLVQ